MRGREFITLVGGAAAWPLAVRAQQGDRLPTIGFLGQSTRSAASEWVAAFVQRLRELGWTEGRTIAIEYRWSEGRAERAAQSAAEQRDERAPVHSITSSARASSVGGMVRPSAFAVLRLIASSNLTGCSTGRSAGLVPCKILCT